MMNKRKGAQSKAQSNAEDYKFFGVTESRYEFKILALLNNVFIGFCAFSLDIFILSISNAELSIAYFTI